MGLSASQARLFYLTAQLNNLSLKGQQVNDAKTRLALDTQAIQEKYIKALNTSHLFLNSNIFATDGQSIQKDYLTLENLGSIGMYVTNGANILGYKWEQVPTGKMENVKMGYDQETKQPIYAQVEQFEYKLIEDKDFKISSRDLEEGLRNGAYTLVKPTQSDNTEAININGLFYETIGLSNSSTITDETDSDAIKKAEAEYNKDMQEIQMQDKKYEMDQKKIDTQYNAYMQEEESIKSVLSKNVERSYNTFKA